MRPRFASMPRDGHRLRRAAKATTGAARCPRRSNKHSRNRYLDVAAVAPRLARIRADASRPARTLRSRPAPMNFQQLRIIRETMRRNYNLTEVAGALFTSQSGVSKHIKDLEDELGVELFVRRGKRLTGPTQPGQELAQIVERMLHDAHTIRQLADQFARRDEGSLSIATTHTQARYILPRVVAAFRAAFPKVRLVLHQGSPKEIA